MKRIDLIRHLESQGCRLLREGANHSVYVNSVTRKVSTIPRHREVDEFLVADDRGHLHREGGDDQADRESSVAPAEFLAHLRFDADGDVGRQFQQHGRIEPELRVLRKQVPVGRAGRNDFLGRQLVELRAERAHDFPGKAVHDILDPRFLVRHRRFEARQADGWQSDFRFQLHHGDHALRGRCLATVSRQGGVT